MLSSITPLGERARHNRWGVTVGWYVAGSLAAGAALGAALGGMGTALPLSRASRALVLAALAVVAVAADLSGRPIPGPRRQVDEDWLGRYRGWVYGAGFGAQLGAGVTTIVTSATVWLALAAEVLAGSVAAGAVIGAVFGLVRALPLLGERGTASHAALVARQRVLARQAPVARVTATVAACAAALAWVVLA